MALSEPSRLPSTEATPLTEQYRRVREATVRLCATLTPKTMSCSPCPTRAPRNGISHIRRGSSKSSYSSTRRGATGTAAVLYEFHDAKFRYLFNSYYNAVGPMHTRSSRGLLSRPTVQEVLAYREARGRAHARLLENGLSAETTRVLTLGLHHEQQHQELLLTDIKHLFSCNPLLPAFSNTQRPALAARAGTVVQALRGRPAGDRTHRHGVRFRQRAAASSGVSHAVRAGATVPPRTLIFSSLFATAATETQPSGSPTVGRR